MFQFFLTEGTLEDIHIWELAKRIICEAEVRDLGLKILKVEEYTVSSALYNEKGIQNAAYEILQTWYNNQRNKQEAYRTLYIELMKNERQLLAGKLKEWVQATAEPPPFSNRGKF